LARRDLADTTGACRSPQTYGERTSDRGGVLCRLARWLSAGTAAQTSCEGPDTSGGVPVRTQKTRLTTRRSARGRAAHGSDGGARRCWDAVAQCVICGTSFPGCVTAADADPVWPDRPVSGSLRPPAGRCWPADHTRSIRAATPKNPTAALSQTPP